MMLSDSRSGITGADYAVAESGTLGSIHDKDQPRSFRWASIKHIAMYPLPARLPSMSGDEAVIRLEKTIPPTLLLSRDRV
jgi:L-lactate utilization protein LutC